MTSALIGHTGFVGSNLLSQRHFDECFNSRNFCEMSGRQFTSVTCCGIQAVKWWANRNPDADWQNIESLLNVLQTVDCDELILISTIDVYPDIDSGDNETVELDNKSTHAYGAHRRRVERWVADTFANHRIIRLPGLFGPGLKKNVIYDLQAGNQTDQIDPKSEFQWYPLHRLSADLETMRHANLKVVNLFGEPMPMWRIGEECFPHVSLQKQDRATTRYRLTTAHAELFGGEHGYVLSADQTLDELHSYLGNFQTSVQ